MKGADRAPEWQDSILILSRFLILVREKPAAASDPRATIIKSRPKDCKKEVWRANGESFIC